jgi:hypothetical protein
MEASGGKRGSGWGCILPCLQCSTEANQQSAVKTNSNATPRLIDRPKSAGRLF